MQYKAFLEIQLLFGVTVSKKKKQTNYENYSVKENVCGYYVVTFSECGRHQIAYFSLDRISQGSKHF